MEVEQPCVFGRVAAKQKRVFICLIEEQEVLRMERGDLDLRDTIQDYRQVWKRYALDGLSSSFLLLFTSRSLIGKAPDDRLKEVCRRLLELYMEVSPIPDDTILAQREYYSYTGREVYSSSQLYPTSFVRKATAAGGTTIGHQAAS